jgi:hypothetical protein
MEIEVHHSNKTNASYSTNESKFRDQNRQQFGHERFPADPLNCIWDSFFSSASTPSTSRIENVELTTVEVFEAFDEATPRTPLNSTDQDILQTAFRESVQRRKQTAKAWFTVRSQEIEAFHSDKARSHAALPGVVPYD